MVISFSSDNPWGHGETPNTPTDGARGAAGTVCAAIQRRLGYPPNYVLVDKEFKEHLTAIITRHMQPIIAERDAARKERDELRGAMKTALVDWWLIEDARHPVMCKCHTCEFRITIHTLAQNAEAGSKE